MSDYSKLILSLVSKRGYQPLKVKVMARSLGVPDANYRLFRRAVKDLIAQGQLEEGKSRTLRRPDPMATMTGTFQKKSGGFGFVRPRATDTVHTEDIFIRRSHVGDAATGDQVLVRLSKRPNKPGKGPEGIILNIIERAAQQFVGTYHERDGEGLVRIDGGLFSNSISVGDPGAKGVKVGDKAVIEMVRFPAPHQRGEGVITEVLGPHGEPGVDTLSIIRGFGLPDEFPPAALEEARRAAQAFDESNLDTRTDFTDELTITIDPAEARDFDDAVSLRYDSRRKHWHLTVHIADVAHFAPPGGPLDREARNRGTSVYLPQRVIPMFPEIISNNLASLQQDRIRYVKTVMMEFTAKGQPVHTEFAEGAIRVNRRFNYDEVSTILKRPGAARKKNGDDLVKMLGKMREFALILRERRSKRGALELNLPETDLEYDDNGRVTGAHFSVHDISHQIIEEFMLAANEAVAVLLTDENITFLRRTHSAPDEQKLKEYAEFVQHLGYRINPKKATDRFQLQRILNESTNHPEMYAVHYGLLRSLKQAEYSPAEEEHYALASQNYCHFTSPIRRYPDLTIHRLLSQWLHTGRAGSDRTELLALGEHCSSTERRAEQAERELTKLKLLDYLSRRMGMELEIIITSVREFGFFGQAEELPIEGLVHVSTLTDDYYHYDGASHSLLGRRKKRRYRLGDKVMVRVARVDVQRRQLDFQMSEKKRKKK